MDKENILRKIKSCLNMANSTNENEAIIGLRQAQKLMRQHNITQDDVSFSEITEAEYLISH